MLTHAHTQCFAVFSSHQITITTQCVKLNGLLSSPEFDKSNLDLQRKEALSIFRAT